MTRRGLLWAFAAMLGIAITAALTWSVSLLAGQRIGLSSQPVSVIHALAPPGPPRHLKTTIPVHFRSAPRAGLAHAASARPASHATTPASSAPIPAAPPGPAPATSTVQAAAPAGRQPASSAGSRSSPSHDHRDDSGGGSSSSQRDD